MRTDTDNITKRKNLVNEGGHEAKGNFLKQKTPHKHRTYFWNKTTSYFLSGKNGKDPVLK